MTGTANPKKTEKAPELCSGASYFGFGLKPLWLFGGTKARRFIPNCLSKSTPISALSQKFVRY
ncbi:hypothetical protein EBR03_04120 [bacterium]|nr:hypothetical protein [bacterium]